MASSTIFKNFNQPIENKSIIVITKYIFEGKYKDLIDPIRKAIKSNNTDLVDRLKKALPAFTPSGIFEGGRKMEYLKMYSGFVHLDFDKLNPDELDKAKEIINNIPYTFACSTSPSGNGLKVFIEVNTGVEYHKQAYKQVQEYYEKEIGIEADPKCKDITRLCFVSDDPDGYRNINSKKFIVNIEQQWQQQIKLNPTVIETQNNENTTASDIFQQCIQFTENKTSYYKGNRNNYIYQLACNCNRRGIVFDDAFNLISNTYDLNKKELNASIKSAYHNNSNQFAEYKNFNQAHSNCTSNNNLSKTLKQEPLEDYLKNTPTFDEGIFDNLPEILKEGARAFTDERERDVFFTGALSILSGCLPNVSGVYAQETVFPNLFSFIIAPAASGKGVLKFAKALADPYQEKVLEISNKNKSIYEADLISYKIAQKTRKRSDETRIEEPEKPPFKVVYIPANTSYAAILKHIEQNEGEGIICETEADSMGAVFKQDWGGYSDMLRKAFHHETISASRKTDNEYIMIKEAKLSVALSGTPGQVANIISSAEDGLFSRFLFYSFKVEQIWKDVSPYGNTINLDEHFKALSNTVLDVITFLSTHKTQIHLTQQQWKTLNITGQQWLNEVNIFTGEEASSIVKRLGLILFRITMIFTALRKFENGEATENVVCTDEDFEMALHIANVYLEHSLLMYNNLPKKEETGIFKGADNKKKFFEALPDHFKREKAIDLGAQFNLKPRSIDSFIKSLLGVKLSQPSYGFYQKLVQD